MPEPIILIDIWKIRDGRLEALKDAAQAFRGALDQRRSTAEPAHVLNSRIIARTPPTALATVARRDR